mmetsp:Transcript_15222/g.22444  ORF Transcript_15222/g.22444 Transcript_15222/m.22444 type:complete len:250 (-) Transcript_15222:19-768(-)
MPQDVLKGVSHVNKIDMTNCKHFEILLTYFKKNPRTIDFWLNNCVFPGELDQYPQRLVANSWHMAHMGKNHCLGFSGTNDNHWILPLTIQQHLPWDTKDSIWRNLLATNGRMVDVMMRKTIGCKELEKGRPFEILLKFIKSPTTCKNKPVTHIDALIDSGALLAGFSNRSVAHDVLTEYQSCGHSQLKGVTFFEESKNVWMVLEKSGRCMEKDQSPLKEKDTFVLFDEPRCRGVDMKLRKDAVAVLTLG